ncbi:MAG: exodeoxyribonuclease VII small subunit [Anaerolineales bacterium]|nr:exodeoxyribonuclease VII small subunit [Anaerolineales bacterium]
MAKLKSPDKMTYEEAFEELEAIVEQLNSGELPLEQSLSLFERGQALAARCSELLDQAELKLRQLVPDETQGYIETDFEPDDA